MSRKKFLKKSNKRCDDKSRDQKRGPSHRSDAPKSAQGGQEHGQKKAPLDLRAGSSHFKTTSSRPQGSGNRPQGGPSRNQGAQQGAHQGAPGSKPFIKPSPPKTGELIDGRVDVHPDGFGFLIAKDPKAPNIYVGEESLRDVMHRDEVRVRVEQNWRDGKSRGMVVEITKRAQKELMAIFRPFKGGAIAIPFEGRDRHHAFKLLNMTQEQIDLKSGSTVLIRIKDYPSKGPGSAEIIDIVKDPLLPSNDTLRVLLAASWPRDFTRNAVNEAESRARDWRQDLPNTVKDIRHLPLVTIDGRDARDFDDAVCAKHELGGNIRLWVAIADVSLFVRTGSPLDNEAREKSTSVYFPDFVVPMLPEVLSNGVCSLNPFEERPCLVCEMLLSPNGKIIGYDFYEGLMQSKRRLTYEQMQAFMESETWARLELKDLEESLKTLEDAFRRLRAARDVRGAIDLDIPEAQVILAKTGEVLDIQSRTRLDAHKLIEECMLAANECASNFIHRHFDEGMYRIHEEPDEKKKGELLSFLQLMGIEVSQDKGRRKRRKESGKDGDPASEILSHPKDFSTLLEKIHNELEPGSPLQRAVHTLILRTMKQARYSTQRVGHFALALLDYTHFTSPIRRYPDLIVHRLIKDALKIDKSGMAESDLEGLAMHCSDQERRAMDCERKLIDMKKCRYMEPRLGEIFKVWITGVTEKGIFCQIENHFVDGLLSNDVLYKRLRVAFNAETMSYRGPQQLVLTFGTRLTVRLAAVNVETRRIDFDLVSEDEAAEHEAELAAKEELEET